MTQPTTASAATGADRDHPHRYTAQLAEAIELRWQARWESEQAFRAANPGDPGFDPDARKFYCLDMFPYPSGAGLHVGHPEGYTATDILCRYRRMRGDNVLHPMGWDAFGLPAEQYAISTGVHPAVTTRAAIDNFRRQLKRFGFSYDWSREISTIDPGYYRWTQWIWLKAYGAWYDPSERRARPIETLVQALENGHAYVGAGGELVWGGVTGHNEAIGGKPGGARKWHELDEDERRELVDDHRLAYLGEQTVNWCPKLGTVLANEEVIDGRSERGGHPVHRRPLRQWMFRITAYADRLLEDLDALDWPESTRTMQAEWIGRSEGAEIDFPLSGGSDVVRVFTTRPDTLFGATYMVLAPEHPLVETILESPAGQADPDAIRAYVAHARERSDVDRMTDSKEKTGVFTGAYATNPATGERLPVWIADYVLMGYGHGAIMAVPAHDERDFEFARAFGLPIRDVVHPPVLAAIHACCQRIRRHHEDPAEAEETLVNFVSLCMNQQRDDYDGVWETVHRRRQAAEGIEIDGVPEGTEVDGDDGEPATDVGALATHTERRGSISDIWREGLADVIAGDVAGLVDAALSARLVDRLGAAAPEPGRGINSANDQVSLDGLPRDRATEAIIGWLERTGVGNRKVNYKLRDWLFSRQRYWGEPFPIVYDDEGNHHPVSEAALPVELPDLADYQPIESDDPAPMLAKATAWAETTAGEAGVDPRVLPPHARVRREANTMPGWAGSCWYYLRYCQPRDAERFTTREVESYWMQPAREGDPGGVDLYIGGAEHAVLHLLYARFWHKILYDLGEVSSPEPFRRLFHQGVITSFAYQDASGKLVPVDEVEQRDDGGAVHVPTGAPVTRTTAKMSKSLKNVVNPDDIIAEYGADTFRLYEMYMGPLEASKPWNTRDIVGPFRFLQRVWRLAIDEATGALHLRDEPDAEVEKLLHRTIAKVGDDLDRLSFNTAIAALIELVNAATSSGGLARDQLERFVLVLAPFAPHVAEELWSRLGHETTLARAPWPAHDEAMLRDDEVELPVQINGKVRAHLTVPAEASREEVEAIALASDAVAAQLEGRTIRKVIVVPGRIVNVVAS